MDDYVRAALLGLVQALTEFLPVSSSGHLVVAAELFGDEVNDLTFDVGLHLGTTVAVLIYFWRDWALLGVSAKRDLLEHGAQIGRWRWRSRLGLLLALASVPAVIVGAVFELTVEDGLREPWVVGTMLVIGGLVLWLLDTIGEQTRRLRDVDAPSALVIGLAQATALVPGVSRSAATIAAGRGLDLQRPAAARFSFLLSAPIVIGASTVLLGQAVRSDQDVSWGPLLLGALVAAVVGLTVIRGLLAFIRRRSLRIFVWYRLVAGVAVLIGVWAGAF